ncbi:MAG TPA: hypothetical protein DCE71_06235 [Parachlamydiales bacterium]|nr:hypothetical protein [Parachlamydiales bacterium]
MASEIFNSKGFRTIAQYDVDSKRLINDEAGKKIVEVATKVINHLSQTGLEKNEEKQLLQFIEKMQKIDEQFIQEGHDSAALSVCAHALKILGVLRTQLPPEHQAIAGHKFILYLAALKDVESLEDPQDLIVELTDFQRDYLLPALLNAANLQELRALEPIVDECLSLYEKLFQERSLGPAIQILQEKKQELIDCWNVQQLRMHSTYQKFLTYEKGQIGDLSNEKVRLARAEKVRGFVGEFIEKINDPLITREEKIAIFLSLKTLQEEFAQYSVKIEVPIERLFYSILKNELLVDLEQVRSINELRALGPFVKKCLALADKLNNKKINGQMEEIVELAKKKRERFDVKKSKAESVVVNTISEKDRRTIEKLGKEIVDLKPVIGDANAYNFSASYGKYIDEAKTKSGSLSLLAAGLRAHVSGKRYSESPKDILKLGNDLLKDRSGQCDHMAAAVIAKIVKHIQEGGEWDADVELAGNGGHSFVIINRPQGRIPNLDHWEGSVIVDTWLESVGVNQKYQKKIPMPKNGIISDPQEVRLFATAFGAKEGKIGILRRFTAEDLRALARSQSKS